MRKLYRSKTDHKIAGVCGGLGEYFQMDSVFFRILFLVIVLLGGMGDLGLFGHVDDGPGKFC